MNQGIQAYNESSKWEIVELQLYPEKEAKLLRGKEAKLLDWNHKTDGRQFVHWKGVAYI